MKSEQWLVARLALTTLVLGAAACGGDDGPSTSPSATERVATRSAGATGATGHPNGGWRTLAPMPTPRSEVAAAELNGEIYIAGGFEGDGSPSAKVEAITRRVTPGERSLPFRHRAITRPPLCSALCS